MNDKPIAVAIADGKKQIVEAINNTKLPPCILEMIIKDLYLEISALAKQELDKEQTEVEE